MTILHVLIWNLLAPASISALAMAVSRRLGRNSPGSSRGRWGVAIGLGVGYLAGHVGILGWPGFPPLEGHLWVAWFAPASAILGTVLSSVAVRDRASWAIKGFFVAGLLGCVLGTKLEQGWTPGESAIWLGGLWIGLMATWWNLEAQAERLSGPGWVVPLGLVAAGWAVVQGLSGGASLAQLDGVLASTLLGALLTVGLRPGLALIQGGPPVVLTVLAGLGLTGYFDSEVPASAGLILGVAPWVPWVDRIGLVRRRSYWTRASVRFLAVLLTVGAAVFLADAEAPVGLDEEAGRRHPDRTVARLVRMRGSMHRKEFGAMMKIGDVPSPGGSPRRKLEVRRSSARWSPSPRPGQP